MTQVVIKKFVDLVMNYKEIFVLKHSNLSKTKEQMRKTNKYWK